MKRVCVIGGGLSGLASSIRLAKKGFDVTLLEKNDYLGGKAGQISDQGFRFDSGPSLVTMKWVFKELFDDCDKKMDDYLELQKLNVNCKYFYNDKSSITAFSDQKKYNQEVALKTGQSIKALEKFQKSSRKIYELTADIFLYNPIKISTIFSKKFFISSLQIFSIDPFRTLNSAISSFFSSSKLIQIYNRFATFNGSDPFQSPATLNIISHVETQGCWLPKEGIRQIPKALTKLALELGVNTKLNVDKIQVEINDKKVSLIKYHIDNQEFVEKFDDVIFAGDIYSYNSLLTENLSKFKIQTPKKSSDLSSSAIIFYWGVKGTHENLDVHNILFSNNYKQEFEDIFKNQIVPKDPTIYININSKIIPTDAPTDCENWFVMINTPPNIGQNWEGEVSIVRQKIIANIKTILDIDLSDKIMFERISTPVTLQKNTSSYKGSLYGKNSNRLLSAFLRPKNKHPSLKNLYFTGGSVHPGGGMPLALLSAKFASQEIINKY
jgi:phytoene desaturase